MLALLLVLQAAPALPCLTCAPGKAAAARGAAAAGHRFRLAPIATDTTTAKDRAMREDGSRCAVVGARQCTRKPRTIFRTDFTD